MNQRMYTRVTAAQLLIFLFISNLSALLMFPLSFNNGIHFSEWIIPLILRWVGRWVLLIPVLIYIRAVRRGSAEPISKNRTASVFFLLYGIYGTLSGLYRFYAFGMEYAGKELSLFMIVLIIFAAAVYAALKGIEGMVRFGLLVFALVIIGTVLISVSLFPSFDRTVMEPAVQNEQTAVLWITMLSESSDIVLLLFFSDGTKERPFKAAVIWMILSGVYALYMLVLVSATLGTYLAGMTFPLYHITDGAGALQRIHPLFISLSVFMAVCRLSASLLMVRISYAVVTHSEAKHKPTFCFLSAAVFAFFLILTDMHEVTEILFDQALHLCVLVGMLLIVPLAAWLSSKRNRFMPVLAVMLVTGMVITSFSGCSGTQLNRRLIVQGIGIDRQQSQYCFTLITLDTESDDSENAVRLQYAVGDSTEEVMSRIENATGKQIMLSHCLFILTDTASISEHTGLLGYFCRNKEIMKNTNLMVTEQSSRQLLTEAIGRQGYRSEDINVLSDSNALCQPTAHATLMDYMVSQKEPRRDLLLPVIREDPQTEHLTAERSLILSKDQTIQLDEDATICALLFQGRGAGYTGTLLPERDVYQIRSSETAVKSLQEGTLNLRITYSGRAGEKAVQNLLYNRMQKWIKQMQSEKRYDIRRLYPYNGQNSKDRIETVQIQTKRDLSDVF